MEDWNEINPLLKNTELQVLRSTIDKKHKIYYIINVCN